MLDKDSEILDLFTYKIEAIAPYTSFYYGDTFEYENNRIQKVRYEIKCEKNARVIEAANKMNDVNIIGENFNVKGHTITSKLKIQNIYDFDIEHCIMNFGFFDQKERYIGGSKVTIGYLKANEIRNLEFKTHINANPQICKYSLEYNCLNYINNLKVK